MQDEDTTAVSPGSDDPTAPGDTGPTPEELAFVAIVAGVDRTLAALRTRADMGIGRSGETRSRALFLLELAAGEAADHLHDLRRCAMNLRREEEKRPSKGVP